MPRVIQPAGARGSLRWIQRAVNEQWPSLEQPILTALPAAQRIDWRSPLEADDFAEYRDGSFLDLLGLSNLKPALRDFWPAGGPQWDALGITDLGDFLLVEAKAHIAEMCSPGTSAAPKSREIIAERLAVCAERLGARANHAPWTDHFYQLANRLIHLQFLRDQGVPAYLVLVNFLNDAEMEGPKSPEVWHAAYQVAFHVMGLGKRHSLARYIIEVFPDVRPQAVRTSSSS